MSAWFATIEHMFESKGGGAVSAGRTSGSTVKEPSFNGDADGPSIDGRSRLQKAVQVLEEEVGALDPEVLEPSYAGRLVEIFSRAEKLAAAGKALAARRVSSSGVWRTSGERSPAHWLARKTGTSVSQGANVLETAQKVAELPGTERALRSGQLSETQAAQIASAAAASPSSENELLQTAKDENVTVLKQHCARVKAASHPDEASRHEAIFRSRYLRTFSDEEGAFRLDARLTPESGAVVMAALEPLKQALGAAGKKQGRRESYEAYAADALVEMADHFGHCRTTPSRILPPAQVHIRVDYGALVRGELAEGEICEVPAVGPISVSAAKAFLSDCFVSLMATDGHDIKSVLRLGRTIPARLRTAVEQRDQKCVVPGCSERNRLEIDHTVPISEGGITCLDNLGRLCRWHHYLKTYQGYRLSGTPGKWVWQGPKCSDGEAPLPSLRC